MKILWKDEAKKIALLNIKEPVIRKQSEVKIKMRYAMLSDLDYNAVVNQRVKSHVPGCELVGTITDLGEEAKAHGFQVGDRVTSIPIAYCGICENCQKGAYNSCIDMKENDGALQEFLIRDYMQLFKVPKGISDKQGCLIWPLAEAIEAVEKSNVAINSTVLILGRQYSSILLAQLAEMKAASKIVIVDYREVPKTRMLSNCIEYVDCTDLLKAQRKLLKETDFMGFDAIFCVTDNRDLEWNFQGFTKPGGTFCLLSFKRLDYGMSFERGGVLTRNISLISSYLFNNKMRIAADLLPRLKTEEFISSEYSFQQADLAFEALMEQEEKQIGINFVT